MAGYWPHSFWGVFVVIDLKFILAHKKAREELDKKPTLFISALVSNAYIY